MSPGNQILRTLSNDGQAQDVVEFTKTNNLSHKLDVFQKAALILRNEVPLEGIPGLTGDELTALQRETERKWKQPKMLYFVIGVCSIVAIEQGWAQTSMNGANLYFPDALGIGSNSARDAFIVGLINSGIYLSTGVLGAWLSSPINNRGGRRGALFFGSMLCLLSTAASGFCQSWPQLLACRLILGVGLGINASTAAVYAAESAPALIRGGLAVSWQMFVAFGVFLGFVANASFYGSGDNTWRLQLTAPVIPTVPIALLLYTCPESPAWYIKKNARYDKAFQSLRRLRNTELQAAREIYATYLQHQLRDEALKVTPPFWRQLVELVTIPRIRRATMGAYTVMLSQQLCGINIVAFYSSTIFSDAGFSTQGALLASCIFGFVNFVGAFPAVWTMDTLGRRSLLLLTLPIMALTMFLTAMSFNIPKESQAHFIMLATLIYLFCAEYSPGMGPVPNSYSAEVFPISHREVGMSMSVATTNIWGALLSITFPRLLNSLGSDGAFSLYAFLNLVAVTLVFLFVPETRQKTLDELDDVFAVPTRKFIQYQVTEFLPWFFRYYVLRRKQAELRPLTAGDEYRQLDQEDDAGAGYGE
jgi:sugar porter (SP) family MFS transporter